MNKETPALCTDRMKFIVAAMTKDYDKARCIASAILNEEPGNTILHNYLSALEKERNKRKRIDDDSNVSESESDSSVDSSSDNTDSNSDTSTESDDSSQNIVENENTEDLIEPKKICHRFNSKDLAFDFSRTKRTSSDPRNRHDYVEINKVKFGHTDLRGKMIRVLPIRLSEKISVMK